MSINTILFYQRFAALQHGRFNFNTSSKSKRCRRYVVSLTIHYPPPNPIRQTGTVQTAGGLMTIDHFQF